VRPDTRTHLACGRTVGLATVLRPRASIGSSDMSEDNTEAGRPVAIPTGRPVVSFLAWTPIEGRSAEIAAALGGEAHVVYDRRLVHRSVVPLRYFLSSFVTLAYLIRRRPRAVIVTNPPLLPGLISWAYCTLHKSPIVLDTHPGGFGAQGDRVSQRLQLAHRWLARRVSASMVTDEHWVKKLAEWGAEALVIHEAPPIWSVGPARAPGKRPVVLFVGTFGGDEPIDVVFDAARSCPELDIWVTGDPRRCPPELLQRVPENVRLTGFLAMPEYASAMQDADLVLTLSTEPTSVMRAAYEAVYVGRPLVLSDSPGLRTLFPYAVAVPNTSEGIARGLRHAIAEHERLRAATEPARDLQQRRWDEQLRALSRQIDPVTSAPARLWVSRPSRARSGGRVASGHETGHGSEPEIEGAGAPTKIRVAGLPISLVDWTIVEAWARNVIDSGQSGTLCTIAPFQAYLAGHDEDYRACLDRAGVVLVDGNGVRLLIAASGRPAAPRLTGRELVERVFDGTLFSAAAVAVVGGTPQAHERLAKAKPDWYLIGGSFAARPLDEDARVVAQQLDEHDANVVLVALGSPKMELWSDALARYHAAVYCSIGGAVDTVVGVRQPPPDVVTRFGLEFAWRAAQNPALLPRLARGFSAMPRLLMTARGERGHQRPVG